MSVTESSIIQIGTRVRVRRGRFPADPSLLGRAGTVIWSSPYQPDRVQVTLDGESQLRVFSAEELEITDAPPAVTGDVAAARKRLSRP